MAGFEAPLMMAWQACWREEGEGEGEEGQGERLGGQLWGLQG
jgi:hypothetical protein